MELVLNSRPATNFKLEFTNLQTKVNVIKAGSAPLFPPKMNVPLIE